MFVLTLNAEDQMPARGLGTAYQGAKWCRRDLRLAIYLRDGMACMYCGREDDLTLDHLTPHSQGGSNRAENLVTCCQTCNSARADRSLEEFAQAAAGYLNRGITAGDILGAIADHTAQDIKPFRAQAKDIIARRPQWQAALHTARRTT